MVKIILSGAGGTMGQVITKCVAQRDDCEVVAGIDPNTGADRDYPLFATPGECGIDADVIVDFSHPSALSPLLEMAKKRGLPIVIATTGLEKEQIEEIHRAAAEIPVFYTANMSLGVNLQRVLARNATKVLGGFFDIEIIEKHHNQKIDAPSGTALMLANAITEELDAEPQYVYDRQSKRTKRAKNEIGIHAIRGGTIVGEHDVLYAGRDEYLTISHRATSKEVFATGAVSAALFMKGKLPGLYDMSQLMEKHGVSKMNVYEDNALVTFRNIPNNLALLADIFGRFSHQNIVIDMVSQTSPVGENISISFTCLQSDMSKVLTISKELCVKYPQIQPVVSSGNCKIILYGEAMRTSPGVFSRAMAALANTQVEVQQITTSETDISFLVTQPHLEEAVSALKEYFGL